jgi:hypothetical protein
MSYITRQLPETSEDRQKALHLAENKRLSIPPAKNPLTAGTTSRLTAILADYNTKNQAIANAKLAYSSGTPQKDTAGNTLRTFISHFIQVFNLGVARGKYPAAHRSAYELPIDSAALPELTSDSDLLLWGSRIVTGDANRLVAGGLAMTNPDAAEVDAAKGIFHTLFTDQSNRKDALDNAQETLEAILDEADKVIRKIWDELEAHYNEETDESRRENMREWGVIYVTTGKQKTMSGIITYNGAPSAGLFVRFKSGKKSAEVNAAGSYSISTRLMNNQKVVVEKREDKTVLKEWEFDVTLNESGDLTANFTVND